jgi:hypothetical protein
LIFVTACNSNEEWKIELLKGQNEIITEQIRYKKSLIVRKCDEAEYYALETLKKVEAIQYVFYKSNCSDHRCQIRQIDSLLKSDSVLFTFNKYKLDLNTLIEHQDSRISEILITNVTLRNELELINHCLLNLQKINRDTINDLDIKVVNNGGNISLRILATKGLKTVDSASIETLKINGKLYPNIHINSMPLSKVIILDLGELPKGRHSVKTTLKLSSAYLPHIVPIDYEFEI